MTWPLKPAEKGKIAVAKGRGGPIQISYEIHGTGPMNLVVSLQVLLTELTHQREYSNIPSRKSKTLRSQVVKSLNTKFLSDVDIIFSGSWA